MADQKRSLTIIIEDGGIAIHGGAHGTEDLYFFVGALEDVKQKLLKELNKQTLNINQSHSHRHKHNNKEKKVDN